MTEREIHDAYERMGPDDAARERMLERLRASAAAERRRKPPGHRRAKHILIAAVLSAGLLLAACGYGLGLLWRVNFGRQELTVPQVQEDGSLEYSTSMVDMISMQGFAGSPEFEACREWMAYLENYDSDGALLAAVGNEPTGIPSAYDAYLCYTWEMAEELDRICKKYGLALLGQAMDEAPDLLLARTGTEGLCDGDPAIASATPDWGYYYADGTFLFEGTAVLSGEGKSIDYQFSRAVKGSLNTLALNIESLEEYEQWVYTTRNGVPLLLADNGVSKALVIADRESSFVVINVLGDWTGGSFDLTPEELERFVEAFDFTAIP